MFSIFKNRVNLLLICLVALFLFATFPGKGGLEGDQRNISLLSQRTDNWGFATPWVYGGWPNFFGHWRFSLVVVQLCVLWLGLWLLFRNSHFSKSNERLFVYLLIYFASIFASQLWRDSTLLAISTFALGVLSHALKLHGWRRHSLFTFSLTLLIFAAMFKPLYSPILAFFFIWLYMQELKFTKNFALLIALSSLFLIFSPYLIDKSLSKQARMIEVAPEQQPMIFDFASSYCWGQSTQLINDATRGLRLVLKPGYPLASVCASLRPNSWDNLHSNPNKWQFSSPIERLSGKNIYLVPELRDAWISMMVHNPIDWLQVRLMYLGPTLTLSNSIVAANEASFQSTILSSLNMGLWKVFLLPSLIIDKTRLTSPIILIAFILLCLGMKVSKMKSDVGFFSSTNLNEFIALLIIICVVTITIVGYVASNGRYVLPYVLLTYFLLMRSRGCRSPIQV